MSRGPWNTLYLRFKLSICNRECQCEVCWWRICNLECNGARFCMRTSEFLTKAVQLVLVEDRKSLVFSKSDWSIINVSAERQSFNLVKHKSHWGGSKMTGKWFSVWFEKLTREVVTSLQPQNKKLKTRENQRWLCKTTSWWSTDYWT